MRVMEAANDLLGIIIDIPHSPAVTHPFVRKCGKWSRTSFFTAVSLALIQRGKSPVILCVYCYFIHPHDRGRDHFPFVRFDFDVDYGLSDSGKRSPMFFPQLVCRYRVPLLLCVEFSPLARFGSYCKTQEVIQLNRLHQVALCYNATRLSPLADGEVYEGDAL